MLDAILTIYRDVLAPAAARWTDTGGRVHSDPVHIVLAHLCMHQIHHRGQVHDMLSVAGVSPPQLDEFFLSQDAALRQAEVEQLEDVMRDVQVVFDTVGGDMLARSRAVLAPSGRLVTVAAGERPPSEESKSAFFLVRADAGQLTKLGRPPDAVRRRSSSATDDPVAAVASASRGN